jgi:putative lipoprotein
MAHPSPYSLVARLVPALLLAGGTGTVMAQEAARYACESGKEIGIAVLAVDPPRINLSYDERSFEMFSVAAETGLRFSTEQGLTPDRGLQWASDGETGTLSEMVMDHTAGAPTVIETCRIEPTGQPAEGNHLFVAGEVYYLERIMLPGEPSLTLSLIDPADGAVITTATLVPAGALVPFSIRLDPSALEEDRRYALTAEIHAEGSLWFNTPEPVEIDPAASQPISIRLIRASEATALAASATELPSGSWRATAIFGVEAVPDVLVSLTLPGDGTIHGNGGCNNFGGSVEQDGTKLSFPSTFATMMACIGPSGDQEQQFLIAMEETASFAVEDTELVFFDESGTEVLRFARI